MESLEFYAKYKIDIHLMEKYIKVMQHLKLEAQIRRKPLNTTDM